MTVSGSLENQDLSDGIDVTHSEPIELSESHSPGRTRWQTFVLVVLFLGLMICLFLFPLAEYLSQSHRQGESLSQFEPMPSAESLKLRVFQNLTGLWFFVLGATIGSFLNVIVHRWPRGESIVSTPSRCPNCSTAIQFRDNVPVIGWLALGGRCRACGMPIDIRYPVIEAITGLIFFLFFAIQLVQGNSNIPGVFETRFSGGPTILNIFRAEHLFFYCFHCLLASIVLVWSLIDFDSQRLGRPAQWLTGLSILAPVVIRPELLLVPLGFIEPMAGVPEWVVAAVLSVISGLVGWLLGWITQRLYRDSVYAPAILAWFGMGLGWQAALAILIVSSLIRVASWLPLRAVGVSCLPWSMNLLIGFVIHHTVWRWTFEHFSPFWPGPNATLAGWIVTLVTAALLTAINYWVQRMENRAARSGFAIG